MGRLRQRAAGSCCGSFKNARPLQVLGVKKDATAAAVKSAFRRLAKKYHPDVNPGNKSAETKFKEINEAYDVLKDGDKRAAYDRFGHAAFEQGGMGGGPGFGAGFASSFSDIFEDLFGMAGQRSRGGRERGEVRHHEGQRVLSGLDGGTRVVCAHGRTRRGPVRAHRRSEAGLLHRRDRRARWMWTLALVVGEIVGGDP